jgi:hypothetical protein
MLHDEEDAAIRMPGMHDIVLRHRIPHTPEHGILPRNLRVLPEVDLRNALS